MTDCAMMGVIMKEMLDDAFTLVSKFAP